VTIFLSFFLSFFLVVFLTKFFSMKNVILTLLAVLLVGLMGCEPDVLEKETPIDYVNISNKKGEVASLEFDSNSGALLSSSDSFTEKSDITYGTVYEIIIHENGNRTINCWVHPTDICYRKGDGPGPCMPCDGEV